MRLRVFLALLAAIGLCPASSFAQTTAFTYQGRLSDAGNPANGSYDLQFSLYDAGTNGNQAGSSMTNSATAVTQGLFTVTLDFGDVFAGSNYWLQIAARTNGGTTFTLLSPRQAVTPAPYAIAAGSVTGPIGLSQLPALLVTNGANVTGSFYGNGGGLTNVPGTLTAGQSNSLVNLVTNGQFNVVYIAPNGTNDMTGILNKYLMTPGTKVELASGGRYYCTNLVMTNNVYFELNYASIVMALPASGYLLDTCLTSNANQTIVHGIFEGQNEAAYQYTAVIPLPLNLPELYPSSRGSSVGPRSGVHLNFGAGGSFSDNVVRGFNGVGVNAFSTFSTGGVTNSYFSHNTAIMDFVGFVFNFGFDEVFCNYMAETAVMDDCAAYYCGIGCIPGAGNDRVQGCTFNNNYVGLALSAGCNNAHGIVSHSTLNHNFYGIYCSSVSGGELIANCAMYDNLLPNVFYNSVGIMIIGCVGQIRISALNGSWVSYNNNVWPSVSSTITTTLTAVTNSAVYFNNNHYGPLTDLTELYGSGMVSNNVVTYAGWRGDGGGLTNLNTYYPSNSWSLAAFTNGMANFSYKTGASNGQAFISLYLSNGVPYIQKLQ